MFCEVEDPEFDAIATNFPDENGNSELKNRSECFEWCNKMHSELGTGQ
jgi:hypothetical protein